MPDHKADIKIGDVAVEVKSSDMRDRLVANLRSQTRQSRENRQANVDGRRLVPQRLGAVDATKVSMVEGDPQAVLIQNRSEHLAKDIMRLRHRYAKILAEQASE
ncbi:hypothetical protein [Halalkalibacter lacteus]|uniref:hypothetical protein n=1 Tax=Halalkalibacter lacteus TaxID=3090663 RepID=UPI002FC70165